MRNTIITILLITVSISIAYAVPARKGFQTYTQPDGTTIELQLVGDEWYHYYVNRDGQKMRQNDAGYWRVITDEEFDKGRNAQRTRISAPRRHTMHVGDTYVPSVRVNSSGAIVFYTDDPHMVSIDPITGTITALKEGWVQVIIEVASTRTHSHATRTIRVHVLP